MLSKSAILAAEPDLPRERVDIPEWAPPGTDPAEAFVFVKTMTAGQCDQFEATHRKDRTTDFRARLAVATVCDEHGNPLFVPEDIPALSRKGKPALDRIVEVAARLNNYEDDSHERLVKNSEATPGDSSASASLAS